MTAPSPCRHGGAESDCAKCRENARWRRWYRDGGHVAVSLRHKRYYATHKEEIAAKNAAAHAKRKAQAAEGAR